MATKTRYAIRRADGLWFHQPTDTDIREWRPEASTAHRWVDFNAAASAAWIWHHLKAEDVRVVELTLNDRSKQLEYST